MKRIIFLVSALALVTAVIGIGGCDSLSAPSSPRDSNSTQQTGIWVSGQGEVNVVPDIAVLSVGVEVQKTTVSEAYSVAEETMEDIIQTLIDNGIMEEDIKTQYFNINQVTDYRSSQPDVIVGYTVRNIAGVTIRDIDKTSDILGVVAAAGGDYIRINNLSFSVDDPEPYRQEARDKALADAREKAEQIAETSDVNLGEPTYIAESSYTPYPIDYGMAIQAPIVVSESGVSISPGETTIAVTVQVAYSID